MDLDVGLTYWFSVGKKGLHYVGIVGIETPHSLLRTSKCRVKDLKLMAPSGFKFKSFKAYLNASLNHKKVCRIMSPWLLELVQFEYQCAYWPVRFM